MSRLNHLQFSDQALSAFISDSNQATSAIFANLPEASTTKRSSEHLGDDFLTIAELETPLALNQDDQAGLIEHDVSVEDAVDPHAELRSVSTQTGISLPANTLSLQKLCRVLQCRLRAQNERIERLERQIPPRPVALLTTSATEGKTGSQWSAWDGVTREALAITIEEARANFESVLGTKVDKQSLERSLQGRITRAEFELIQQQIADIQEGLATAQQQQRATRISQSRVETMVQDIEQKMANPQLVIALRQQRLLQLPDPRVSQQSEHQNRLEYSPHKSMKPTSVEDTGNPNQTNDQYLLDTSNQSRPGAVKRREEITQQLEESLRTQSALASSITELGHGHFLQSEAAQEHAARSQMAGVLSSQGGRYDARHISKSYTVTVTGDATTIKRIEDLQRRVDAAELALHLQQVAMKRAAFDNAPARNRKFIGSRPYGGSQNVAPPTEEQLTLALEEFVKQVRQRIHSEIENSDEQVQEARERHAKLCFDLANLQARVNPGENTLQFTSSALHRMEDQLSQLRKYVSGLETQTSLARDTYAAVAHQHAQTAAAAKKMVALCERQAQLQIGALGSLVAKRKTLESRLDELSSALSFAQRQSHDTLQTVARKLSSGVELQRGSFAQLTQWRTRIENLVDALTKVSNSNTSLVRALHEPIETRLLAASPDGSHRHAVVGLIANARPDSSDPLIPLAEGLERDAKDMDMALLARAGLAKQLEYEAKRVDQIGTLVSEEDPSQTTASNTTSPEGLSTPVHTGALLSRLADASASEKLLKMSRIVSQHPVRRDQRMSTSSLTTRLTRPHTAASTVRTLAGTLVSKAAPTAKTNFDRARDGRSGSISSASRPQQVQPRPHTSGSIGLQSLAMAPSTDIMAIQRLPAEVVSTAVELTLGAGGGECTSEIRGGEADESDRPTTTLLDPIASLFDLGGDAVSSLQASSSPYGSCSLGSSPSQTKDRAWVDLSRTWTDLRSTPLSMGAPTVLPRVSSAVERPKSKTQLPVSRLSSVRQSKATEVAPWTSEDQTKLEQRLSLNTF